EIDLCQPAGADLDFGDLMDVPHAAVGPQDSVFHVHFAFAGFGFIALAEHALAIVGMETRIDIVPRPRKYFHRDAEDLAELLAQLHITIFDLGPAVMCQFCQAGRLIERGLALAQFLFALLEIGYVLHRAKPGIGRAGRIGLWLTAVPEIADGPVRPHDPELNL